MEQVASEQAFHEQIGQDRLTIAVFKADWCKDCHFINPFMPELVQTYADRIRFIEVDRDQLPDLCERYGILGIPSFIAFRRGQELIRFVSKLRKTKEEITQFLDRAVEVADALPSSG